MARNGKTSPATDAGVQQLSIFDIIREQHKKAPSQVEAGSMNITNRLREEISRGLKQANNMSRYEVAAKMSELVGAEISKSQLDSWTAESKEAHRFPAEYLPAFCAATEYKQPLRIMAEMIQCYLLESEEALLAELGKIDQAKRDLTRKERAIREFLQSIN